ncbi:MAG TPA: hypothetical protein VGP26_33190 [Actinophytocola sp.]|nr:hypothetical protein [Actinophytocola sp.]
MIAALAAALSVGPLAGFASAGPADAGDLHCVTNLDTKVTRCATTPEAAKQDVGPAALTIAIFYDGTGYSGTTYTWVQAHACTPSYDEEWQWDDLSGIGWNNRVSSVHTYNQCDVKFFDGFNFTGASSTWIDQSSNLGTMGTGWSNRAGSVKFS